MNKSVKMGIFGFVFGFLSTVIFHQVTLFILAQASQAPIATWDMTPVPPLGVPKVISLAFFGGLWGAPLIWVLQKFEGIKFWSLSLILGAIFPTAVAMLVVLPLKGIAVTPQFVFAGLIVNAAWGLGVAVFFKLTSNLQN
ncbi:MAG: hypothetical protein Fur0010_18250 [Bdellovibrio sp.]